MEGSVSLACSGWHGERKGVQSGLGDLCLDLGSGMLTRHGRTLPCGPIPSRFIANWPALGLALGPKPVPRNMGAPHAAIGSCTGLRRGPLRRQARSRGRSCHAGLSPAGRHGRPVFDREVEVWDAAFRADPGFGRARSFRPLCGSRATIFGWHPQRYSRPSAKWPRGPAGWMWTLRADVTAQPTATAAVALVEQSY